MTVDVLVPTLWRPGNIEPFLDSLRANTDDFTVLFVCQDGDDATISEVERHGCAHITVAGDPATANQKVNAGYRASSSEFFFVGSDDIRFTPRWLDTALTHMDGAGVEVVGVSDGIPSHMHGGELPGHVLVRRSYIEQQSGVFDEPNAVVHEGYRHYFSDIEFWQTAHLRGCFRSAHDSHITHLHPNAGTADLDAVGTWARANYRRDMALWMDRAPLLATGALLAS